MTENVDDEIVIELTKELMNKGRLVEAGWLSLKLMAFSEASPAQQEAMRNAFFAGAHHVFNSIMATLDPGEDATKADENRLTMLDTELQSFITEFAAKYGVEDRT